MDTEKPFQEMIAAFHRCAEELADDRHDLADELTRLISAVETVLRESEDRYWQLLASVTDYVYEVTVEDGRPVATRHGPGCVAVTGYSSRDYEADSMLWHRMVHTQDRPAVEEQAARALAGEPVPPLEHRIRHKDGSIRWLRSTIVPHRDPSGRHVGYDGLITDISDRRLAEEALRESEEKYRTLFMVSSNAVFVETLEGRILDCNGRSRPAGDRRHPARGDP
jgi:PAS domain S-box-containing protein